MSYIFVPSTHLPFALILSSFFLPPKGYSYGCVCKVKNRWQEQELAGKSITAHMGSERTAMLNSRPFLFLGKGGRISR